MPSRESRQTRARRRAGTPPADSGPSSDEEVTFQPAPAAADPEDDVSTLAGSDDEAPESVGLSAARQEAEALLRDLADSRRRRDDSRRQRDRDRQERNREQKLDKQRRMEQELMDELADELAAEEAEEVTGDGDGGRQRPADGAPRPKKKRFKYPTPAVSGALDFIPLAEGQSTTFKAAALPTSQLPAVVNPELMGLRERLLYSGRVPRTSSRGLAQLRHKQRASGKYGR
ncbi:uncharacterized protein LOC122388419 isoform X1 [Amphibalanus amphitrite]|uniref:uncharacterized protein LOC122388419 isoform X1 n=1 Tax=Amphibalanus amphitrite TaxID=1232801 RepID=UPI001C91906B|nr:uncharacterized protein LOC122388419 isoform X1 [Amphibalanus amphitrite]XP_043235416.1 uncharacterized protein LOC122388419 isoform X1 [Amphibalanus amphitrite]XP_043235417.1 uncharacterized protein LOC122388419 isoform X1 [Amphibalanus amphitrite]XP_043235418.1 uncharacterized protein LOC122388419 isoform X1 [Amphibalanus amphitrite]